MDVQAAALARGGIAADGAALIESWLVPKRSTPPPSWEVLPRMVQFERVAVPLMPAPPPACPAVLPAMVQPSMISVPDAAYTAPPVPPVAFPLSVQSLSEVVAYEEQSRRPP